MREKRVFILMLAALVGQIVFADGGWKDPVWQDIVERGAGVPYYGAGAQALKDMNDIWIEPIKYSVVLIIYTAAALLAMYSGTVTYIKLQTGDEGFMKSVANLFGAILFLFSAVEVVPGFFGEHGENVMMYTNSQEVLDPVRQNIEAYILPVRRVILAIGAIVAVAGSIRIYWKMNNQDQDIKQSVFVLVMSCVFLLFVAISIPAFFGFKASSVPMF